MSRFRFPLAALLQYREHQRELCQQLMAQAIAADQQLIAERDQFLAERAQVLDQLQQLAGAQRLAVDQLAQWRYHAQQLQGLADDREAARADVLARIALCRQALTRADQGVKVLEQLRDRQQSEHTARVTAQEDRAREEAWSAAHWKSA